MTFKLGLTGSIGMGKSTTGKLFVEFGCVLWDADAAVHRMYAKNGAAVDQIAVIFPSAIKNGTVSRDALKSLIQQDSSVLKKLETIVHPLVAADRAEFVKASTSDITVLDIPLLFELGNETMMDATVCVSVSPEIQEKRVLERGTMSAEQFQLIRAKQMPNDDKCARADYVVVTDTVPHARQQVQDIVTKIREQLAHA